MDIDAGGDSDGSKSGGTPERRRSGSRRRKKFLRPKARSQSDVSRRSLSDEESLSVSPTQQAATVPNSPYKKILNKPKKRIQCVINTLKRFAPHKLRHHREKDIMGRKGNLQHNRLYSSHPNVSSNDLVAAAHGNSIGTKDDSVIMVGGYSSVPDGTILADGASYSDPTINRNPSQDLLAGGGKSFLSRVETEDSSRGGMSTEAVTSDENVLRQRRNILMKYAFYQLEVHLRFGKDLQIRDACGTSDPYVKFKIAGKQLYKSRTVPRTLEPYWDEFFTIPIEDVFEPLHLRVYDYDFALQDDYMGSAQIDLTHFELNRPSDYVANLTESGKPDATTPSWGQIFLTLTLIPKSQEDKEQEVLRKKRRKQ